MFELIDSVPQSAEIKVVGVGGGGGNALNHMLANNVEGVEFICANTDAQALKAISAKTVLQLGGQVTKGLGAGANPEIGRQAAMEDRERIIEVLQGADMVFITAGMGGGTGTGAAPVFAQIARELGILTVAVVTKPFAFEGRKRAQIAEAGIAALAEHVDSLITIPNEKLLSVLGESTSLLKAFGAANDVLLGAVQGIADLIIRPGMINVDFADVRTVMSEMGMAMMGSGSASGENRAKEAAEAAVRSPLLEDVNLQGARGILVNITAGPNLSLGEFSEVGETVEDFASDNATVVVGTVIDPEMGDELRVTVVATGLGGAQPKPKMEIVEQKPSVDGRVDYGKLDRPTVMRKQALGNVAIDHSSAAARDMDYLDIPAFLRRQAD
ncbi:MAG: cell division protein FtsZ [Pseudomonadales bacterium]|nr:cell division protein FtsZ [Pseudomonadales bacterium]MCP5215465.1 cell division protein FtsZ [Pseudomonadales bacterium]